MKKNAAQQAVCWPGRRERQQDSIYLLIYLFMNQLLFDFFPCVRVKTGDINSQIRERTFFGRGRVWVGGKGVVERAKPRAV